MYVYDAMDAGVGKLLQSWLNVPGHHTEMKNMLEKHKNNANVENIVRHLHCCLAMPTTSICSPKRWRILTIHQIETWILRWRTQVRLICKMK